MQTGFNSGQFRLANIQSPTNNSGTQDVLSSIQPNQTIKADVLSATLQQISQQHTIAQYKAEIVIQGKVLEIITQFPLDKGDQLELKLTPNQQLTIERVTAASQNLAQQLNLTQQLNNAKSSLSDQPLTANKPTEAGLKTADTGVKLTSPVTQEQISNVIKLWLTQSRPTSGSLFDLGITMEVASEIIRQLPNSPYQSPSFETPGTLPVEQPKPLQLSNLLLLTARTIQAEVLDRIPNTSQANFKEQVLQLVKELISWQPTNNALNSKESSTSVNPGNTPQPVATSGSAQQTIISALTQLQGLIDQALSTSSDTSKTVNSLSQPPIPILRDWTQVLTLMSPTTQSQDDLLDWMLESIRRISGTGSTSELANQVTASKEALNTAKNTTTPGQTEQQAQQPLNLRAQNPIDSSQWLRLAEFRKHQLFTGTIKESLLQGTSELQLSNVFRQLLVSIEEITGRLTALRLASAASQLETSTPTNLHLDIPITTASGPTSVQLDITDAPEEEATTNTKQAKSQWMVHLKFELAPLAPFIAQIIYDLEQQQLSASFYTDHQDTLSLLNQNLSTLESNCRPFIQSDIRLTTRFGMIAMPRETIVKNTSNIVSVKV